MKLELSRMPTFWIYTPETPLKSTKKQDLYHDVSGYSIPWKILMQIIHIPEMFKIQWNRNWVIVQTQGMSVQLG